MVKLIKPDDEVEDLGEKAIFDVESTNQKIDIVKELSNSEYKAKVNINNPLLIKKNDDYLALKPYLERKVFGNVYDDNIHIQMAYAILDIKKILNLYVYNTCFALNRYCNENGADEDCIGTLNYKVRYSKYNPYQKDACDDPQAEKENNPIKYFLFEKQIKGSENYFPVLMSKKEIEKSLFKDEYSCDVYNYNCLRILSYVRQSVAHSLTWGKADLDTELFSGKKLPEDLSVFIDEVFDSKLESINKSFEKNAIKNLTIIARVTNKRVDDELLKKYYEFSVMKEQKNLGISLVTLKEQIYETLMKEYNVFVKPLDNNDLHLMPKINLAYEFVLWDFLKNHSDRLDSFVTELRMTLNDEEKNFVYKKYARSFIMFLKGIFIISGRSVSRVTSIVSDIVVEKNLALPSLKFDGYINANKFNTFTKIMYIVSEFLNGKEKNELLTSLINKIDNIYMFKSMLNDYFKENVEFANEYKLFNEENFTNELKLIKNISKMSKPSDVNTKRLYRDALNSLGLNDKKEIDEEIKKLEEVGKGKHQFRNFVINNVINSNRFLYIAKYINPSVCTTIINNEKIVNFVLKNIPEEQIVRYHENIFGSTHTSIENKITELALELKKFNYKYLKKEKSVIENVKNKAREKIKSLAGLYYTISYLVVKSLIKVNSVYCIAFSMYERDCYFAFDSNEKFQKEHPNFLKDSLFWNSDSLALLKYYLNVENHFKKHDEKYLTENIKSYNEYFDSTKNQNDENNFFKFVRNKTVHLEVVKNLVKYSTNIKKVNSYYELYHFIFESMIIEQFPKFSSYNLYNADKNYSRNMLKIVYLPLAYNLARYKNLTIEDIFNSRDNKNADIQNKKIEFKK